MDRRALIAEIELDATAGVVRNVTATFVQNCDGGEAELVGCIHYEEF